MNHAKWWTVWAIASFAITFDQLWLRAILVLISCTMAGYWTIRAQTKRDEARKLKLAAKQERNG